MKELYFFVFQNLASSPLDLGRSNMKAVTPMTTHYKVLQSPAYRITSLWSNSYLLEARLLFLGKQKCR